MAFTLSPLPYATNALEPHIDARTMEIHHGKHHQAYINNVNTAIAGTDLEKLTVEQLIGDLAKVPDDKRGAVRNNGGGHANHSLFWTIMGPGSGGAPSGDLAQAITSTFGSLDTFKEQFAKAGATRFGSGWAWLVVTGGKLAVGCTSIDQPGSRNATVARKGKDYDWKGLTACATKVKSQFSDEDTVTVSADAQIHYEHIAATARTSCSRR